MGIIFVGPSAEVMARLGDKIASKLLAEQVGVPLAAWSGGPVADIDAAREHAERIGYPLMVKATAGGGGRGIRQVERPEDLDEAFERASLGGAETAGDATVFMERAIRGGRHVEVQVVADAAGDVWTLGVRDCTVQRRNQKVLEESASTALDAEQEQLLRTLGRRAGRRPRATSTRARSSSSTSRASACCRSWRSTPGCRWSTRVTEATTGVDIVKLQLHVAGGGKLAEIAAGDAARARARDRGPAHRRGPRAGLRPRAGPASSTWTCPPARACASTPAWRRATPSRRSSTR